MTDKNKGLESFDFTTGTGLFKSRMLEVENNHSITVKPEDEMEVTAHVRTFLGLITYQMLEMDVS